MKWPVQENWITWVKWRCSGEVDNLGEVELLHFIQSGEVNNLGAWITFQLRDCSVKMNNLGEVVLLK